MSLRLSVVQRTQLLIVLESGEKPSQTLRNEYPKLRIYLRTVFLIFRKEDLPGRGGILKIKRDVNADSFLSIFVQLILIPNIVFSNLPLSLPYQTELKSVHNVLHISFHNGPTSPTGVWKSVFFFIKNIGILFFFHYV